MELSDFLEHISIDDHNMKFMIGSFTKIPPSEGEVFIGPITMNKQQSPGYEIFNNIAEQMGTKVWFLTNISGRDETTGKVILPKDFYVGMFKCYK